MFSSIFVFFEVVSLILGPCTSICTYFRICPFFTHTKKNPPDLGLCWIYRSIDPFRKAWYPNDSEFSGPGIWYICPFIWIFFNLSQERFVVLSVHLSHLLSDLLLSISHFWCYSKWYFYFKIWLLVIEIWLVFVYWSYSPQFSSTHLLLLDFYGFHHLFHIDNCFLWINSVLPLLLIFLYLPLEPQIHEYMYVWLLGY